MCLVNNAVTAKSTALSTTASTIYNGLFYQNDAVRLDSAGSFTLTLTSRGKYSGRIQIGSKRYSFSGFLSSGQSGATNVICATMAQPSPSTST